LEKKNQNFFFFKSTKTCFKTVLIIYEKKIKFEKSHSIEYPWLGQGITHNLINTTQHWDQRIVKILDIILLLTALTDRHNLKNFSDSQIKNIPLSIIQIDVFSMTIS
jgi:hypothetical protein